MYFHRFGCNNNIFSFESGRRAVTGAACFAFKCSQAEDLFQNIQQQVYNSCLKLNSTGGIENLQGPGSLHKTYSVDDFDKANALRQLGNALPNPLYPKPLSTSYHSVNTMGSFNQPPFQEPFPRTETSTISSSFGGTTDNHLAGTNQPFLQPPRYFILSLITEK